MTPRKLHQAIVLTLMLGTSSLAVGQITVSVNVAPPELPVYDQPPIPGDGYLWTPGYWAWSDDEQGYYWVPGTWVEAPQPGYLWTPGYWEFNDGVYLWNTGYWGPHVGFYGGVNYGYGYGGRGYEGGYWQDGRLFYNRSVVNVGTTRITNVYNKTVINNVTVNRVSFNGGNGGARAAPTPAEQQAVRERHVAETSVQRQHIEAARQDPALRASENHGRPPVAATAQPGHFTGNVAPARGAATAGPERGAVPGNSRGSEARAGNEMRVPENHDNNGQTVRRNLDRDQQGPAGRPAEPQARAAPRSQPQMQQEPRSQPEMRAAPPSHPMPPPRPSEPQREVPREARPVERVEPQMRSQAPRPPAPEPRAQPPRPAEQRAPERTPEHH